MNDELITLFEEFREHAKRLCGLIEASATSGRYELLSKLHVSLANLYGAALRLPDIEPETDTDEGERPALLLRPMYDALTEKFEKWDKYWEIFDPTQQEEPVSGSLADDLTDIFRDLQKGLAISERGASVSEVLWEWRFSFKFHWGRHAMDALRAIHWLIFDHLSADEDDDAKNPSTPPLTGESQNE